MIKPCFHVQYALNLVIYNGDVEIFRLQFPLCIHRRQLGKVNRIVYFIVSRKYKSNEMQIKYSPSQTESNNFPIPFRVLFTLI